MVDRYHLAKLAITAIVADESFIDPSPDDPTPDSKPAFDVALKLVDELMKAFGLPNKV